MKNLAGATFGLLLASSGMAADESSAVFPGLKRVRAAYAALAANPDLSAQSAYLEAFPEDAKAFLAVFMPEDQGPVGNTGAYIAPLGEIGKNLPGPTFGKLLKIETAARWEPGGLDDLQQVSLKLALANPRAFAGAFTGLRPTEQRRVAAFLADGSEGPREDVLGLAAKLEVAGHRAVAGLLREEASLSEAHLDT
jgi:hypothetical protein